MTLALQLVGLRRVAFFCAATGLLHYLAIDRIDGGAGAPQRRQRAPVPVLVELRAPPPPQNLTVTPQTAKSGAPVPDRQVQSVNSALATQSPATATSPYRVDLPPSAQLSFSLVRAGTSGGAVSGGAVLDWQQSAPNYTLRYEAWLTEPAGSLVEMASDGRVARAGIIPRTMTDRRRSRARTATHFDERGNISFSAAQGGVPMQAGAQDKATWPLQLAGIARADRSQLARGIEILVGESRYASVYRLVVLGPEEIMTGMGRMDTWRLARLPLPGSHDPRLDIWLAPEHEWYPVQLRSTESNGTVTTQTIRGIVVNKAGN
jgi:hypothetical protein